MILATFGKPGRRHLVCATENGTMLWKTTDYGHGLVVTIAMTDFPAEPLPEYRWRLVSRVDYLIGGPTLVWEPVPLRLTAPT